MEDQGLRELTVDISSFPLELWRTQEKKIGKDVEKNDGSITALSAKKRGAVSLTFL